MNSTYLHTIVAQAEQIHTSGHLEEAAELYRRILDADPTLSRTAYNLGIILLALQDYKGAENAFSLCLASEPDLREARLNYVFSLQEQGRIDDALASYQAFSQTNPDSPDARFNIACLQLLKGELPAGFEGYELRFATNDQVVSRHLAIPLWTGILRSGLRLLVHAEQGYGDTIQMLRYLPQLISSGLKIILEVPAPLYQLCSTIKGLHCIERGSRLPDVDCRLPIMSLPRAFGTTLDTIPGNVPYIEPDKLLVSTWLNKLPDTTDLRIGICWAGRFDLPANRKRSCPPALLLPLLAVPCVSFVSLQISPPDGFQFSDSRLLDYSSDLTDFNQTAALIANLDLVITIDTAAAHLAGALGIPTWLMLPAVPDWRWLLDREDSPWYPSMRLFRQPTPGMWEPVIARMADRLARVSAPRIWTYRDGPDFDSSLTSTRLTPLSDPAQWPSLGITASKSPATADWLLFPYYLEHLAEYQTIGGMWSFLEQLQWFSDYEEKHLLFCDHDCEAPYISTASWFRASIDPHRADPAASIIPYQVAVPREQLHFDLSRIQFHISFTGFLGLLRERVPMINGVIAESRLVHKFDLATSFHLHQTEEVRKERRKRYLDTSSASICVLCPRGEGSSSLRFFETLALGRIPIIQEHLLLPFSDRINYPRFVIRIPKHQENMTGTIVFSWLSALSDDELLQRCHEARATWERHLSPEVLAKGVVRNIRQRMLKSMSNQAGRPKRAVIDWQGPLDQAAILLLEGKLQEARHFISNSLECNPRSALAHVTMGGIEQELGNDNSAESHLLDAICYNHRCYDAYLLLGSLLARTGRPVEAIGRLYQASMLRPDEPLPYQLAMPILQQQGRHDEVDYCQHRLRTLAAHKAFK